MHRKRNMVLLILTLVAALGLQAQVGIPTCGINYDYDNAGNRVKRYICISFFSLTEEEQELIEDRSKTGTEEDSADLSGFIVFPNPTSGDVIVEVIKEIKPNDRVLFLNDAGQKVYETTFGSGNFNIGNFTEGVYFILIHMKERTYHSKIIKTIR